MTEVTVSEQDLLTMAVYVADIAFELGEATGRGGNPVICRRGEPIMSLNEWVHKGVTDFVEASGCLHNRQAIEQLERFIFSEDDLPAEEVAKTFLANERFDHNSDFKFEADRGFTVVRLTSVIQRARQDGAANAKKIAEKAEHELAEARARERQKDRALERIGRPMDCGCNPCRGQCRSQEALQIEIDAIKDEANEALAAPAPGKDSEGKE